MDAKPHAAQVVQRLAGAGTYLVAEGEARDPSRAVAQVHDTVFAAGAARHALPVQLGDEARAPEAHRAVREPCLEALPRDEIMGIAAEYEVDKAATLRKQDLVFKILQGQSEKEGNVFRAGVLEIVDDNTP